MLKPGAPVRCSRALYVMLGPGLVGSIYDAFSVRCRAQKLAAVPDPCGEKVTSGQTEELDFLSRKSGQARSWRLARP
jgi:hypothetical protein